MDSDTARIVQQLSKSFNAEIQRIKDGQRLIRDAMESYSNHVATQMQLFNNRIEALENDSETGCDDDDSTSQQAIIDLS